MSSLRRFFGRTIENIIALILNVALVILGAWLYSTLHTSEGWQWSQINFFPLAAVILLSFLDLAIKHLYDRRKASVLYQKLIHEFLEASALSLLSTLNPPRKHIRVNVMFSDGKKPLSIRYHYGFHPTDEDLHIIVPLGTGVAGQAWLHEQAMVADVTQLSHTDAPPHWGLPRDEIKKIRHSLQSVFSVPIKSGADHRKIGVLNIDSDNSKDEMQFGDERIHEIIFCLVAALGNVLDGV